MIYYITKYGEKLKDFYKQYRYLERQEEEVPPFVEQLISSIYMENDNTKLLCIKDWLLYALHTMHEKDFSKITPCISCSYGDRRFDVAYKFGKGYCNNYFVVMDSWVKCREEGISYKRTDYVNEILKEYGINKHYVDAWKENSDFEIGEPIYFEQMIDFEKLGPYNTIYEYSGRSFSVAGRRN